MFLDLILFHYNLLFGILIDCVHYFLLFLNDMDEIHCIGLEVKGSPLSGVESPSYR